MMGGCKSQEGGRIRRNRPRKQIKTLADMNLLAVFTLDASFVAPAQPTPPHTFHPSHTSHTLEKMMLRSSLSMAVLALAAPYAASSATGPIRKGMASVGVRGEVSWGRGSQ